MEYIKLFQENLEVLDELNDGQIAQLFKAIRDYSL
jgi:hypothetical protein